MKRLLLFVLVGCASLPLFAHAAFNDVTLEQSAAIISANGYDLTIYGSDATIESITVNSTDFSITLNAGSAAVIASADRVSFNNDADAIYIASEVCTDTESRLGLSSSSGNPTITITPSGTCTPASSGSGGDDTEDTSRSSGHRHSSTPQIVSPSVEQLIMQLQLRLIEVLKQLLAQLIKEQSAL